MQSDKNSFSHIQIFVLSLYELRLIAYPDDLPVNPIVTRIVNQPLSTRRKYELFRKYVDEILYSHYASTHDESIQNYNQGKMSVTPVIKTTFSKHTFARILSKAVQSQSFYFNFISCNKCICNPRSPIRNVFLQGNVVLVFNVEHSGLYESPDMDASNLESMSQYYSLVPSR